MQLHGRTAHLNEDQMCIAVNKTWRNTGITDTDIRSVFYRQPCLLLCVLAKRNKDNKLIWSQKPPPQPPPSPTPSPTIITNTKDGKPTDHREDHQWSIGECISYNNVGPISPESIEGYRQFIAFRDTRSNIYSATQSKLATRRPFCTT